MLLINIFRKRKRYAARILLGSSIINPLAASWISNELLWFQFINRVDYDKSTLSKNFLKSCLKTVLIVIRLFPESPEICSERRAGNTPWLQEWGSCGYFPSSRLSRTFSWFWMYYYMISSSGHSYCACCDSHYTKYIFIQQCFLTYG